MEGVYFDKLLSGAKLPELPVLRPPFFVFITAADYLAGGRGVVLALFLGLSIFFTYYFSLKLIDSAYSGEPSEAWYAVPLAISLTVYPMNFIKPYLLADGIAIAFSLASVFLIIKYDIDDRIRILAFSVVVAAISGMTQTYGLIPYFVSCVVGFLYCYQSKRSKAKKFILAILSTLVIYLSLTLLWRRFLPHEATPKNFDLLKISIDMFGFYLSTWGYYFIPLILFFSIFRRYKIVWDISRIVIPSSAITVIFFALLCLSYQWPEARFTYYFWPWMIILLFSAIRFESNKGAYFISAVFLLVVFIVPNNYWAPSWQSMRVTMFQNWIGNYFGSSPIDRKLDVCGDDCDGRNDFLNNSDPYVNNTVKIYNYIKGL